MKRVCVLAMVGALLATACDGAEPAPSTSQTTVAPGDDARFELIVQPDQFALVAPGQLCVALASVTGGTGPVALTATVTGGATVEPAAIDLFPGDVADFTIVPDPGAAGATLVLELEAARGTHTERAALSMEVVDWPDDLEPLATELRDRFVAYLEQNHPELGITAETEWTPSITKPQILVVMHYLFFSEEWEMGITWHVTVPEHAWSRMYLRPRNELYPTFGLEIPSYLDAAAEPVPWEPPESIDR